MCCPPFQQKRNTSDVGGYTNSINHATCSSPINSPTSLNKFHKNIPVPLVARLDDGDLQWRIPWEWMIRSCEITSENSRYYLQASKIMAKAICIRKRINCILVLRNFNRNGTLQYDLYFISLDCNRLYFHLCKATLWSLVHTSVVIVRSIKPNVNKKIVSVSNLVCGAIVLKIYSKDQEVFFNDYGTYVILIHTRNSLTITIASQVNKYLKSWIFTLSLTRTKSRIVTQVIKWPCLGINVIFQNKIILQNAKNQKRKHPFSEKKEAFSL